MRGSATPIRRLRHALAALGAAALALAGAPTTAPAQEAGSLEVGGAFRYSRLDKQQPIPEIFMSGWSARAAIFAFRNVALEGSYGLVTGDTSRHGTTTGRVVFFVPGNERLSALFGVGASYIVHEYAPAGAFTSTSFAKDFGGHGIVGLRGRLAGPIWWRIAGTADYVPTPSARFGIEPGSADIQLSGEAGLSLAFTRTRDTDRDGVNDKRDRCAGTPSDAPVDASGCPRDSDADRVPDFRDRCADTPSGAPVDASGCVLDTDADRIPENLDRCPDTPRGAPVDARGCTRDADDDGVGDHLDRCPGTPSGVRVNARGCPIDSDGDGVTDDRDRCQSTPAGTAVNESGCPRPAAQPTPQRQPQRAVPEPARPPADTDADGVPDDRDRCPTTVTGQQVDATGCPPLFGAGQRTITLEGVTFAAAGATLTPQARSILNRVAESLIANPEIRVEVAGHTDSRGTAARNLRLSTARAQAVRSYLVSRGIPARRLVARGYGSAQPIADNGTESGRAQNRRVELRRID